MTNKQTVKMRLVGIRITGVDKDYYLNQLQIFADNINSALNRNDIVSVEFGRQDIRGVISICLVHVSTCVAHQKFFKTKDELLGYICGYNSAKNKQPYL